MSLDPIYLDFDMSESDYLTFARERARLSGPLANKIAISLGDENRFTRTARSTSSTTALDRSSGTIHARATVPNPDLFLVPGEFARIRVAIAPPAPTLLVPDAAVVLDQSQHMVMTVSADGTVVPEAVETGDLRGGLRVIQSGLGPDDRVIIDGLVHAIPGSKVDAAGRHDPIRRRRRQPSEPRLRTGTPTMRLSHIFIDRPIFATVLSVFVTLIGLGALAILPVAQYPEIVPPTVQITTVYPGASAETVSRTVATPLEQQINGVENMLYMSSQSTGDGKLTITVTFRIGTDLNVAQMLTQNRVQDALPRLPEDVQRLGVQVRKATPNILLAVHLYSPDSSRDNLYMSNYATLHVKDALARLPGVGDVQLFGARDYAMRIWLDPDKVAAHSLNASEVLAALRAQNVQVSAGILNQPPVPAHEAYQINVQTLGRLSTPEQFADIVAQVRRPGTGDAPPRRRPRRDRRRGLRLDRLHGPRAGPAAADLRPARREFAGGGARGAVDHGRPWRRTSRPASATRSSTIRRSSSANRSMR